MTAWDIYWVMQLDSIITGVRVTFTLGMIVLGVLGFIVINESGGTISKSEKTTLKAIGCGILLSLMVLFGTVFIPSTRTAAAMYVLPRIANSDAIQKDLPEIYDMAIEKVKESLNPEVDE